MPAPIAAHLAVIEAQERLLKILVEQYDADLVALWQVDPVTRMSQDGYHLPPVACWYRQPAPSRITMPDPQHNVAGFVGQIDAVQYGTFKNGVGASFVVDAQTPFGIGIYFIDSPQPDIADPIQPARRLGVEEVLLGRALRYLGALKHTLVQYGCHSLAIADVTPTADMGLGGEIASREANNDDRSLLGIVMLELNVGQFVAYPSQKTLPATP